MMTPASFVLTKARRVRVSCGEGEGERESCAEAVGGYEIEVINLCVRKVKDHEDGNGYEREW
jgi:hypothetical protein